jgi:hypothetical protein
MKNNTASKTATPNTLKFPAVPAGAADRTFRFRADNANVGESLLWMVVCWAEGAWLEPNCSADAPHYAQVTLAESAPDLAELRWLFQQVSSADLALATLNVASAFDGTKSVVAGESFETQQPCGLDVERAQRGLQIWVQRTLKDVGAASVAAQGMGRFSSPGRGFTYLPPLPGSGHENFCEHALADQDALYLRNRLPFATKPGAEARTFCFRVEFEKDIVPLTALIKWAVEDGWQSREGGADTEVKFTLREGTLTLDEVRWLFDTIADCHVAVQTLALAHEYTGKRTYEEASDMGATPPKGEAMRRSREGAGELREYYEGCAIDLEEASQRMKLELE